MENGEKKSPDTLKDLADAYQFFLRHLQTTCHGNMGLARLYIGELEKIRTELLSYTERYSKPVAQSVARDLLQEWNQTVPMLIRLYVTWKSQQLQAYQILHPEMKDQWTLEQADTDQMRDRYLT